MSGVNVLISLYQLGKIRAPPVLKTVYLIESMYIILLRCSKIHDKELSENFCHRCLIQYKLYPNGINVVKIQEPK